MSSNKEVDLYELRGKIIAYEAMYNELVSGIPNQEKLNVD